MLNPNRPAILDLVDGGPVVRSALGHRGGSHFGGSPFDEVSHNGRL